MTAPQPKGNLLRVSRRVAIPLEELEFTYARSGGPGGQNVNKVASKTHLRWRTANTSVVLPLGTLDRLKASYPSRFTNEGDILLVAQTHRDQERNRQECLDKLVDMIRQCLQAPTPRKKTKPTWGSQLRRMDAKRRNSAKKEGRRGGGQD